MLGTGLVMALFWGLWTGVIVNGFFAGANAIFAPQDTTGSHSTDVPGRAERSGSAQSLAAWEGLGYYGRSFVRGGPTVAQLEAVNGPGAKEPIRVYAGLQSADTVQGRADLVLAELKRTGAFDRKVLVVATTTGMGFLDSRGTDPLEYLWNGDTAIAGVQYSYLPSWISVLADQEAVVDTSAHGLRDGAPVLGDAARGERPELYLYGLSLGSMGVESVLTLGQHRQRAGRRGAHGRAAVRQRDARPPRGRPRCRLTGIPAGLRGGAHACASPTSTARLEPVTGAWGPTRVAYLQHASDPVVFFSSDLAFDRPELARRRPARPRRLADDGMGAAGDDVAGAARHARRRQRADRLRAHVLGATPTCEAWAAVSDPPNWSADKAARIDAAIGPR